MRNAERIYDANTHKHFGQYDIYTSMWKSQAVYITITSQGE